MQTSTKGGSADTDETELTVMPNRPAMPSVVTMLTPVTAEAIALVKSAAVTDSGARTGVSMIAFDMLVSMLEWSVWSVWK
jgi:hypothetical protein